MCEPATPAYTVLISTPAMVWAASIASRMERTVHSMLLTTPLRRPRQGTLPTPRMVMPSASTSPTTAETFVVPRSSPTTISLEVREDFMVVQRLRLQSGMRGRDSADAAMRGSIRPNFGGWFSCFSACFAPTKGRRPSELGAPPARLALALTQDTVRAQYLERRAVPLALPDDTVRTQYRLAPTRLALALTQDTVRTQYIPAPARLALALTQDTGRTEYIQPPPRLALALTQDTVRAQYLERRALALALTQDTVRTQYLLAPTRLALALTQDTVRAQYLERRAVALALTQDTVRTQYLLAPARVALALTQDTVRTQYLEWRAVPLGASGFLDLRGWNLRGRMEGAGAWSSHPHHDALGVRLVIQEDDARSTAFFAQFPDHFFGHEQLLAPRTGAQFERHAVFAAGQGHVARVGQMHFFRRVNAAQRQALELAQDVQSGLDAFDFALSVALEVFGGGAGDQRHVERIAGRDLFEGHTFMGDEVQALAQGHHRARFAFAELHAQGIGQAAGHFDLGDPGIFEQFSFGRIGIQGE